MPSRKKIHFSRLKMLSKHWLVSFNFSDWENIVVGIRNMWCQLDCVSFLNIYIYIIWYLIFFGLSKLKTKYINKNTWISSLLSIYSVCINKLFLYNMLILLESMHRPKKKKSACMFMNFLNPIFLIFTLILEGFSLATSYIYIFFLLR